MADEFDKAAPRPYRLAGDAMDGRLQFTILDATGRHIIGVDALDRVLAGYGAKADEESRCSVGQPESNATARLLVRAVNAYEPMRAAIEGAVEWYGHPGENANERFERHAEQFYRVHHMLAPGKSEPMEMYAGEEREEERWKKWREWCSQRTTEVDVALAAALRAVESPDGTT